MFNKLTKYLRNKEYLISFNDETVHIYNYKEIKNIDTNNIDFSVEGNNYKITGTDFIIVKMEMNEVLIKGKVNNVIKK